MIYLKFMIILIYQGLEKPFGVICFEYSKFLHLHRLSHNALACAMFLQYDRNIL